MKRLLLFPLLLLLCSGLATQALSNTEPVSVYSELDTGLTPGFVFGFLEFEHGTVALGLVPGPMANHTPRPDRPNVGVGGSTIASEWISGGIKRTVTTHVTGGRNSQRLAIQRHNRLVVESLRYWPQDP